MLKKLINRIKLFLKTKRGQNILQGLWIGIQYIFTFIALTLVQMIFKIDFGMFGDAAVLILPALKNTIVQYQKHLKEQLEERLKQDSFATTSVENPTENQQ